MTSELDAFRSVNFDWTRQLRSIWRDPPYHVPSLHRQDLDGLIDYFATRTCDPDPTDEPLGRIIVGPAGYGKTHLIGELRRRVWKMDGWFVLLDFIGVKDFWSSVALGFLNSLQVRMPDGRTQYDRLVLKVASLLGIDQELTAIANRLCGQPRERMTELIRLFVTSLSHGHFNEASKHRDVVAALILLNSEDLDCHSIAHGWLQGMNLDAAEVRPLGFKEENTALKVVRGLSWVMSLVGPTLIAVDQIDAIVSASNALSRASDGGTDQEKLEAQSIVALLAEGLMDLHEQKRRAVTVVSCLEATWKVLQDRTTVAVTDRYGIPTLLSALPNADIASAFVAARVEQAYRACNFQPPYETWPFADAAFESVIGYSPRQLLKACEEHRQHCVAEGKVTECLSFVETRPTPQKPEETTGIDQAFESELKAADIVGLLDQDKEDRLRDLLDEMLRLFEKHLDLPDDIDVAVQRDPDQKRPSLHARLSFTFRRDGDREQHYCFRILGHTHATAFQSRLKAAMTASGIDTALKFRHLFILRRGETPIGPKTAQLIDQFRQAGGKFIAPTDAELRAFVALRAMSKRDISGFDTWLRQRKPLFETPLFKVAGLCPPPFLLTTPQSQPSKGPTKPNTEIGEKISNLKIEVNKKPTMPRVVPIGRRYERGVLGDPVTLAADLLPRHVAILAGSGSGKTVLLRRLVEEAALLDIPSIVLDINNDLARLGDTWPARPEGFSDEDGVKAAAYHQRADIVIWTPGRSSGKPISLKLLPDFSAIGEDPDEREQAVEMTRATLTPFISGSGASANLKQGVLTAALRRFAEVEGSLLDDLIRLLADLPEDVSQISKATKLGAAIADQLHAAIETNPLLKSAGPSLDPKTLFHTSNGKTRLSVINLSGLGSDDAQQSFVNQLQMTLFTWIKQNPSPTGRLYVLDEAQNFAPSQAGTACKASALSLAAQARKYGLGMIFATQLPKGIDNRIVSNCTTHFYGRMSSPTTIETTRELMAAKGGAAEDIGRLTKGEFYFSTDGFSRPIKVRTPLCLSWHSPNPPTVEEVLQRARTQLV
jgi:Helicase HerA, central domain